MIRLNVIRNRVNGLFHWEGRYEQFENEKDVDSCQTQSNLDDDKITVWQAGWNITNAIQVKSTFMQTILLLLNESVIKHLHGLIFVSYAKCSRI